MKTAVKLLAGLAISALTLWLFLRNLDFGKVGASLAGASVPLLLLSIALGYFGHLSLRARRWATMLRPIKTPISFYNLFSTTAIGYAVTCLAPGRLGEVARPVLLARRETMPVAGVLATAAIERVFDAVTVVALAALAAITAPLWWSDARGSLTVHVPLLGTTDLVRAIAWMGAVGLAGCVAGVWLLRALVLEDSRFLKWVDTRQLASSGRRATAWGILRRLADGAAFLRSPGLALRVGAESVLIWTVIALGAWIGLLAARVRIPFPGSFLMVALSAAGISVPTPGGAGTVHIAYQRGLIDLFGIEPNLASAATVLYHPISAYIPPVVFGLIFAWRDGLRPGKLRKLAETGEITRVEPS